MVSSYLRFGAGVLLLSAGLFLGATGGATAVADTDSESGGSSADGDGGADGSSQDDGSTAGSPAGPTATDPTGSITDTLSTTPTGTLSTTPTGVTSTFGSAATEDLQPSSGDSSTAEPAGADTETTGSDFVAAEPSPIEPGPTVVEPVTNVVESGPSVVASAASVVEPPPAVDPPAAAVPPPVPGPATPVANVVAPVPVMIAQAFDVVAALEEMLTSVAGAVVSFTQPPADLFALLGFAWVDPALGGVGGHGGRGLSTAAGASVLDPMVSPLQMVLPRSAFPAIPSAGDATEDAALAGITTMLASQESSLPAQAPPMPDGVIPVGVQEFFQQVVEEVKRSPGLAVLAAAALPGLGGLLVVTAAGIRLGYRQAKAGFALHAAGIARFARSGPIGVVRSGSLIAVRSRPLNVVRAGPLHAGCVLDEAA